MAEKGANVVINGLGDAEEIEKTRVAIEADFGVRCTYSPANMLNGDEIAGMIADAEKDFGSVDILVNNAGIQFVSPVDEFPVEKWDAIIAINLTSAFHAIRAALPGMKTEGLGPDHQHGVRPCAGGLSLQIGLCGGQARHRRPDQDGRAGSGATGHHSQRHLPGLRLDAAGGSTDPGHHEGAGNDRGSRSRTTSCWRRSRPRNS
jgi:NAD(P)-dependent dehydrogenase (short-subunit alcohol dehydrogenase family)